MAAALAWLATVSIGWSQTVELPAPPRIVYRPRPVVSVLERPDHGVLRPVRGSVAAPLSYPKGPPERLPPLRDVSSDPRRFFTWWDDQVHQPVLRADHAVPITLDQLLVRTLMHSARVKVLTDAPLVRETAIMEANAEFDWTQYIESRWEDLSEPVGSTLTTGGPPRLREHDVSTSLGVRRKNTRGGRFDIAQQFGHQDTNSIFFFPPNQGNARLTLSYTQPLLRGRGALYNTSLTVLAQIETDSAYDELSRGLQTHLLDVSRAYWQLYLDRGLLLQKRELLEEARAILDKLEGRQSWDTLQSQIVRARAAVAARQAEIIRADTAVRNTEARLRALVNDPELGSAPAVELIPMDTPNETPIHVDLRLAMETALRERPEVSQAIKQVKASGVRLNMAKNELLPLLNVVLQTYASGLQGESDIGGAFLDQFRVGEPSYTIGLTYETPIWNQAAKARYQRRRLELRQLEYQFRETIEVLRSEVEIAVREVETTLQETEAKYKAMQAAEAKVAYLNDVIQSPTNTDVATSLLLEDLLEAQQQRTAAESAYLDALIAYNFSYMLYKQATGVLLQAEAIQLGRHCEGDLPTLQLHKDGQGSTRAGHDNLPTP